MLKSRKKKGLWNLDNAFNVLHAALDERKKQLKEKVAKTI